MSCHGHHQRNSEEQIAAYRLKAGRIARLLLDGHSVRDIAVMLGMKKDTVDWHARRLLRKSPAARYKRVRDLIRALPASPQR